MIEAYHTRRGCAIGLDIGGTKIAGGVVAFPEGRVLVRRVIATHAERPGPMVLDDAVALASDLMREAAALGSRPTGIGLGVAELVGPDGRITSGQTLAWRDLPVREAFAMLGPTVVEADVRAAAWAEARFGAGQGHDPWIYLTVGTGISYSLVRNGRPFAGARGNALICGSAPLSMLCTECGAELHPVLEEIASGPALVARYNRLRPGAAARGEDVLAAAHAGDEQARAIVRSAGTALGTTLAFLINVLDPAVVVVGGGLGLAGGLYWDACIAATRTHIWAEETREVPILHAALGHEAGLIGAAAAAWEQTGAQTVPATSVRQNRATEWEERR
jgi:glucokinase